MPAADSPFPATLPTTHLLPRQHKEKYGYPKNDIPRHLKAQLDSYGKWSMAPINMARSQRYARAIQSTTLDKTLGAMRGYLGWHGVRNPSLRPDLSAYSDAKSFAAFTSYLLARGVSKGQVVKHVSVARKVNDYLSACAPSDVPARLRAADMDEWLAKLECQLNASMPNSVKEETPSAALVYAWVAALTERALQRADTDLEQLGCLTHACAWLVQCALLAALVVGCYVPPCRLHILKTINHPRYYGAIPCDDPDCNIRDCRGNQFQASRPRTACWQSLSGALTAARGPGSWHGVAELQRAHAYQGPCRQKPAACALPRSSTPEPCSADLPRWWAWTRSAASARSCWRSWATSWTARCWRTTAGA